MQRVEEVLDKNHFSLVGLERRNFAVLLVETAEEKHLDPLLVLAVMKVESSFRVNAVSEKGAMGLLQIKPVAAETVSDQLAFPFQSKWDLLDPRKNLVIGIHYLAYLKNLFRSDTHKMLVAYNIGPTAARNSDTLPTGYANKVLRTYEGF